jgi:hypothetical protein
LYPIEILTLLLIIFALCVQIVTFYLQ